MNCWRYLLDWLWTGEPGIIVILSSAVQGLLHCAFITNDGVYHDMIDVDQSQHKQDLVSEDVRRSVDFKGKIRSKPVQQWYQTRHRDIRWVKYHTGSKASAWICQTVLTWVAVTRWPYWTKCTWRQYLVVLVGTVKTVLR